MAKIYDVHSVIVAVGDADFTSHAYTEIYGGSTGCSITINGTPISMGPSSSLFIAVRNVSGGSGCYLLGSHKHVFNGNDNLF